MSELPGRTLLSQWIKAPTRTSSQFEIEENVICLPEKSTNLDRERTTRQWDDIFKKSTKEAPEAKATDPNLDRNHTPTLRKRAFHPRNPFNSFVVTMKFPSHLNSQIQLRPKDQITGPTSNDNNDNDMSNDSVSFDNKQTKNSDLKSACFQRPSYMHKFKVPKQFLETLRPKRHPFFAKQATSCPINRNPFQSSSKPLSNKEAPWNVVHIRPGKSWNCPTQASLGYRPKTKLSQHSDDRASGALYSVDLPNVYIPHPLITPKRLLASSAQIMGVAEVSRSSEFLRNNKDIFKAIQELKPYDRGQFESRMWCDIYSPKSWKAHVNPDIAGQVNNWLSKQFQLRPKMLERKATRPRKRHHNSSQNDSFVVDDEDMIEEEVANDVLLLCGSSGSGKSSAVHAAANSQEAFVFEISSAVKRTGKEIATMLDGITQNYAVHRAKHVVILIDDGDIIFENEAGSFWPTISKFAATSRHPIVITCSDPHLIALSGVSTEVLLLPSPNYVRVTELAWLIALSEGHILDKLRLARMVVSWHGDMRKVLCQLQLWCQMGIGGSLSSEEWVPKQHEMLESSADRVMSQGTWFSGFHHCGDSKDPLRSELDNPEKQSNTSHQISTDLLLTELRSVGDIVPPQDIQIENRTTNNDAMLSTNGALPMPAWIEPVSIPEKPGSKVLHNIFAMESSYGTNTEILASDVAPYMRIMVESDYQRFAAVQKHLTSHSEREARMIRRAWANNGIDTRQYLELSQPSMSVVLGTGFSLRSSERSKW